MFPHLEIPPTIVLDFKQNDWLIVPTDGMIEAFSPGGEMYGLKRVVKTLHTCSQESPDRTIQTMQDALQAFSGSDHFKGDVALVVLKRNRKVPKSAA